MGDEDSVTINQAGITTNDSVAPITTHPHIIVPYKGFKGEVVVTRVFQTHVMRQLSVE